MLWLDIDINNMLNHSDDGLIHTTRLPNTNKPKGRGRKEVINEITYQDADVCLSCPLEECTGDRKCFLKRKEKLKGLKGDKGK